MPLRQKMRMQPDLKRRQRVLQKTQQKTPKKSKRRRRTLRLVKIRMLLTRTTQPQAKMNLSQWCVKQSAKKLRQKQSQKQRRRLKGTVMLTPALIITRMPRQQRLHRLSPPHVFAHAIAPLPLVLSQPNNRLALMMRTATHMPLHPQPRNKMPTARVQMRIRLTLMQPLLLPNRTHMARKRMMHIMPTQHRPRLPLSSRLSANA
jgi:hypothetical protein